MINDVEGRKHRCFQCGGVDFQQGRHANRWTVRQWSYFADISTTAKANHVLSVNFKKSYQEKIRPIAIAISSTWIFSTLIWWACILECFHFRISQHRNLFFKICFIPESWISISSVISSAMYSFILYSPVAFWLAISMLSPSKSQIFQYRKIFPVLLTSLSRRTDLRE